MEWRERETHHVIAATILLNADIALRTLEQTQGKVLQSPAVL